MKEPLNVLLVEDSEDDALLVLRQLKDIGFVINHERVQTAAGMETAFKRAHWDIVISDHGMPGFSGTEALQIVRRVAPDVPFIFVSGSIGEDVAVAAMRAGAQDYVMKGNIQRLSPAISRELADAQRRRRQRHAEEQLRETSEVLRSVFAASPLAIIATDLGGRVRLWNPAAEQLFGWTAPEVVGLSSPIIPADQFEESEALRKRVLAGEVFTSVETRRLRKDGTLVSVAISIAPRYGTSGAADGVTVVFQDLTDRKKLEAQFLQAQKMEAIGRLAGGVAHDFNNLLTVIASYTDLMLTDATADDPKRHDLNEVRRAADAASALTRQLLAFSRQEVAQPRIIELNQAATSAIRLLNRLLGESVELTTHLDAATGTVKVDAGQIEQVIMNLAINARDAMPHGGKLHIETRQVPASEARVAANGPAAVGTFALLEVADTGSGMDEATQAQIFEPFFTTKGPDRGTGLGLATVYRIVKSCNGTIRVRSAPGKGTTFSVYLPSHS